MSNKATDRANLILDKYLRKYCVELIPIQNKTEFDKHHQAREEIVMLIALGLILLHPPLRGSRPDKMYLDDPIE